MKDAEAVVYVGRQASRRSTPERLIASYDFFVLTVGGETYAVSKRRERRSYVRNCRISGNSLGKLMAILGLQEYRIENGRALYSPGDAIRMAHNMPEDGVRELVKTLSKKGLKISPNGNR